MKVIINSLGELTIMRGKEYKFAYCPRTTPKKNCGDWCPLFGDIESNMSLRLCRATLVGTIEDQR